MKTLCFVPVYNQVLELPTVLEELRRPDLPCDDILLVNNGSSDGSEDLIRGSGFPWIEHKRNLGVGRAIMSAAEWALERDYDILTGVSGNGKMLPAEMHRLVDPIKADEVDYVTGSRFLGGGASPNLPQFRRRAIPMTNIVVKALTGQTITDMTCGYRAYRLDLLRRAEFDWRAPWLDTYGHEYYVYAKVLLDGSIRWREVPITMRYPKKGPYTKMRAFVSWYEMIKPWYVARRDGLGFAPSAP
jgi:glycosyltransferase involved in cell wall biosynthesis